MARTHAHDTTHDFNRKGFRMERMSKSLDVMTHLNEYTSGSGIEVKTGFGLFRVTMITSNYELNAFITLECLKYLDKIMEKQHYDTLDFPEDYELNWFEDEVQYLASRIQKSEEEEHFCIIRDRYLECFKYLYDNYNDLDLLDAWKF